jgi:predicted PurR-regulated permease PerM
MVDMEILAASSGSAGTGCPRHLSAIPALLLGLVHSPTMVLYVAILYVVVQLVEGYLLTPLIQQETVALPPALTIASFVLWATHWRGSNS